jgi:hypothetical protein
MIESMNNTYSVQETIDRNVGCPNPSVERKKKLEAEQNRSLKGYTGASFFDLSMVNSPYIPASSLQTPLQE